MKRIFKFNLLLLLSFGILFFGITLGLGYIAKQSLQSQIDSLSTSLQTAVSQKTKEEKPDFTYLKARYYLELAQAAALSGNDYQNTIKLMQIADAALANLQDPQALAIRQAIAQNIAELQAIPKIDLVAIFKQVEILQGKLSTLPIKPLNAALSLEQPNPSTDSYSENWQTNLKNSLHTILGRLVIIRRHDNLLQPLLTQTDIAIVLEQIALNLNAVMAAVIEKDEQLYQHALKQITDIITQYFDLESGDTKEFIAQIHALQAIVIQKQHITLEQPLDLLNKVQP